MDGLLERTWLYDFYGDLLTDKQKRIYRSVVFEDMSLSEIAEEESISRQGVSDMIRRCDRILSDCEAKLGLVAAFFRIRQISGKLREIAEQVRRSGDLSLLDGIDAQADRLEGLLADTPQGDT